MARLLHGRSGTGTPRMHAGHGASYDVLSAIFFGGRRRRVFIRLAALSGAGAGDRALDVGCGTGYFTRIMARAVTPGGTALGVDPSREAITRARRLTRRANCTFSEGTAEALAVQDGSQDVVVSSLVIHHLPQALRAQAVREMFRVLRPAGRLLIAEFRPPGSRIGRCLIGPLTSPPMRENPLHLLGPMAREAGFVQIRSGDLYPWIRYLQATKPASARPANPPRTQAPLER
jgi:ubiquinone/menaquinone biosynthesis C-methylase UbiE